MTGSEALTYGDAATVFSDVLDRDIEYADPEFVEFVVTTTSRGASLPFALVQGVVYTTARLGLASRVTDDVVCVYSVVLHDRSMNSFVTTLLSSTSTSLSILCSPDF